MTNISAGSFDKKITFNNYGPNDPVHKRSNKQIDADMHKWKISSASAQGVTTTSRKG
jgi:hypothetical protein